MGFYFGNHQLETVNKNPIHPIAFLKNHVNSKLLAKVRDGSCFFFFLASPSSKRQKNPHPRGIFTKNPWGHHGRMVFIPFEYNPFIDGNPKALWFKTHFYRKSKFSQLYCLTAVFVEGWIWFHSWWDDPFINGYPKVGYFANSLFWKKKLRSW